MAKRRNVPVVQAPLQNWQKTNPARQDDPVAHYRREAKVKTPVGMLHPDRVERGITPSGMPTPVTIVVTKKPAPRIAGRGRTLRTKFALKLSEAGEPNAAVHVTDSTFIQKPGNMMGGRGEKNYAEDCAAKDARQSETYKSLLARDVEPLTLDTLESTNVNWQDAKRSFLPRVVNVVDVQPGTRIYNLPGDADYSVLHTVQELPKANPLGRGKPNDLIVQVPRGVRNRNAVSVATLEVEKTGKLHSRLVRKETPAEAMKRAIHMVHQEIVLNGQGTLNVIGRR